jgi:hypothetical protein
MIYKGIVFSKGSNYFVHTQDKSLKQKVYLSGSALEDLLEQEIYFELIPNQEELDEQVTYTARFVSKT